MTLECRHLRLAAVSTQLASAEFPFVPALTAPGLEVELYRPVGVDRQAPHERDELYVIVSGHGGFVCAGSLFEVAAGDVLAVPAHTEHRFVDFSDDFATWVVFVDAASARAER